MNVIFTNNTWSSLNEVNGKNQLVTDNHKASSGTSKNNDKHIIQGFRIHVFLMKASSSAQH